MEPHLPPENMRAIREAAAAAAFTKINEHPILKALEKADFGVSAENEKILEAFTRSQAGIAEQVTSAMTASFEYHRELVEQIAAATRPVAQAHAQLASLVNGVGKAAIGLELRTLVESAIELDTIEGQEQDLETPDEPELAIIEAVLEDDSLDEYINEETRSNWASMTPKQRKWAARILKLVLNAVGGIFLLLIGQPWLAMLLNVIVSSAVDTIAEEVEAGPDD